MIMKDVFEHGHLSRNLFNELIDAIENSKVTVPQSRINRTAKSIVRDFDYLVSNDVFRGKYADPYHWIFSINNPNSYVSEGNWASVMQIFKVLSDLHSDGHVSIVFDDETPRPLSLSVEYETLVSIYYKN